jgi:diamine N-acetyltransferase
MYQIMDGVGFIMRLMVDQRFQGLGYGKATMIEILRRLKMMPEIEYIGVSVTKGNDIVEKFYRNLGFIDGDKIDEREIYLKLDWDPK